MFANTGKDNSNNPDATPALIWVISCNNKKLEKLLDLREKIVCYCNLINYKEDFFDENMVDMRDK